MTEIITSSNKDLDKFFGAVDIIAGSILQAFREVTELQADFASLDCMVRDRLSKNASKSSVTGIPSAIAAFSKVSVVGACFPCNHLDHLAMSMSVFLANSDIVRVKNNCLFDFLVKSGIRLMYKLMTFKSIIHHIQITKHLRKQVLCPNQAPGKAGSFKKLYVEYTRPKGRSPSPSFTMPVSADVGGMVMQDYLTQIPVGRERYIYLIHAEGTNRYKIGRSVNPIVRAADIQKQAPYPLKIIKSAWTLDAPFDEAELHRLYAGYRVFGEWFDFGTEADKIWLHSISCFFTTPPTIQHLAREGLDYFSNCLGVANSSDISPGHLILGLYDLAKSRSEMILVEQFVRKTLSEIVKENIRLPIKLNDVCLECFIWGAISTFERHFSSKGSSEIGLNKGGVM